MTMLHTPHVAVAYQAIKLRSYYVHDALHTFLRRTCDVCMANRSCYERVAIFLNMFKKSQRLCDPSRMRRSCNVTATEAFDAVTYVWCSLRIKIRRTFASRFVKV